jgi:hypothetical protein
MTKMFNPNRIGDTTASRLNRLSEFFSFSDLDEWTTYIKYSGYDFDSSIQFLDSQVRIEYWVTYGNYTPDIYDWMERYDRVNGNMNARERHDLHLEYIVKILQDRGHRAIHVNIPYHCKGIDGEVDILSIKNNRLCFHEYKQHDGHPQYQKAIEQYRKFCHVFGHDKVYGYYWSGGFEDPLSVERLQ